MDQNSGENLPTSKPEEAEINIDTLQMLSFELISKSVELWRTYREDKRTKGRKIVVAAGIHKMIIDAIRLDPDIMMAKEMTKKMDELEKEARFVSEKIKQRDDSIIDNFIYTIESSELRNALLEYVRKEVSVPKS